MLYRFTNRIFVLLGDRTHSKVDRILALF